MSRLVTIWRIRAGSASARRQRPAAGRGRARWPRPSSRGSISAATSRTTSPEVARARVDLDPPRLDRATSSRSLTRSTSRFGATAGSPRANSRCFASSPSERASSSTKPLIDVSGLRSSCEAVATNSVFSRSSRARSEMSRTVQTTPSPSISAAVTASDAVVVALDARPRRASASLQRRQRASGAWRLLARLELGDQLARARVDRATRAVGVGRRPARRRGSRPSPRAGGAPPRPALARGLELPGHRVERVAELAQLARARRAPRGSSRSPPASLPRSRRPGRRAGGASRPEQRDQRHRADQRERSPASGDDHGARVSSFASSRASSRRSSCRAERSRLSARAVSSALPAGQARPARSRPSRAASRARSCAAIRRRTMSSLSGSERQAVPRCAPPHRMPPAQRARSRGPLPRGRVPAPRARPPRAAVRPRLELVGALQLVLVVLARVEDARRRRTPRSRPAPGSHRAAPPHTARPMDSFRMAPTIRTVDLVRSWMGQALRATGAAVRRTRR